MSKKKTEVPEGSMKVRVLVDCEHGKCNDVAVIEVELAESLQGTVTDATPSAVAYAESLQHQ